MLNTGSSFPAGMDDSSNPFQKYLDMLLSKSGGGLNKPMATTQAGQTQPHSPMQMQMQQPPPQPPNPYGQALQGLAAPVAGAMGQQAGKDLYGWGKQGAQGAYDYFKGLGGAQTATGTAEAAANTGTSGLDLTQFAEMFPELAAYAM
jgi:hypothetical protein